VGAELNSPLAMPEEPKSEAATGGVPAGSKPEVSSGGVAASHLFDSVKLDLNAIKIILLTAFAVICLLSVPAVYILRNFVTFEALDHYLNLTEGISPKILHSISEEIESGYSKNIILDSPHSHDNTLIFYAAKDQKVALTMDVTTRSGTYQSLGVQVDGCDIGVKSETTHLYSRDLTAKINECGQSDEPSIHSLRVYTKDPLKPGTALDISCLVLVFERVHDHIEGSK